MGPFGDDKFMDDEDYLLTRVDPAEYDSIEEYELEFRDEIKLTLWA